jgi:hypothetical protein
MNTFFAHLDKEWREQRRGLVALLALAALAPLMSLVLPERFLPDTAPIAWLATLAAAALAACLLASDLVPREVAPGSSGTALLARLPHGLSRALHGKALVFVAGIACAAVLAAVSGSIADVVRGGLDAHVWGFDTHFAAVVVLALLPWPFAASTFVTRGLWSVPVALLGAWPAWGLVIGLYVLVPNDAQRVLVLLSNAVAAYAVARIAFVGGHAGGPSTRRALLRGASALAGVCLPLAGYMAHAHHMSTTVEPARDDFRIASFCVDAAGERAWVDAYCSDWTLPLRADPRRRHETDNRRSFVVDVDDGDWKFVGAHGSRVQALHSFGLPGTLARPGQSFVQLSIGAEDSVIDTDTERRLTADEVRALGAEDRSFGWEWYSLGRGRLRRTGPGVFDRVYVDPVTGIEIAYAELFDEDKKSPHQVVVRDGSWLTVRGYGITELLDPRTLERRAAPDIFTDRMDSEVPMLFDGRVVVLDREQRLFAVDPDAPEAAEEFAGLSERFGRVVVRWLEPWSERSARGPFLARVDAEHGEPHYVALAFDPPRLVAAVPSENTSHWYGAWLDAERALVLENDRHLVEIDFARGTRRVVFPR